MENKLKFSPDELTTDYLYNFYKIVEFAPVMVIVTDRDGKIEYVNERFEKINDYQWAEIKNRTPSFLQSGLTAEQTYQELWSTITSGQVWQGEFCNQTKHGELYWQKVSIIPVTNQQGEITHFAAIERNIDQEKKLEKELNQERDFLRRVIDTDPHLIFVKNWEGEYILANQALAEAYGTTPEELEGKTDDYFNPNQAEVEKFKRDDQEVMNKKEKKVINEESFTASEKNLHWFQTIKVPINTDQPKHKRQVLGIATDITERKEAKTKLKKERDKAQKYLNVAQTIILIVNQKQEVELINAQGSQFLGLKEGAVIGTDWFENYIASETRSESINLFRQIINAEKIEELKSGLDILKSGYECKVVTNFGEKRIIEWHGTVIKDQTEQTNKLLLSGQDITNRKQIEKSLRKTNQQLKYLLAVEIK